MEGGKEKKGEGHQRTEKKGSAPANKIRDGWGEREREGGRKEGGGERKGGREGEWGEEERGGERG